MPLFAYAVRRYGISRIVIDSLLRCGVAEDDYDGQKEFVSALVGFAADHGVHIHLVAHSRKKDDESKPPGKLDIRGAAAITDLVHNGFSVWRNKARENAMQEANGDPALMSKTIWHAAGAQLACWKNRKTGIEPFRNLWLNPSAQQFVESTRADARIYLN